MMGLVLIRGGGDLASGAALRLFRAGFKVIITEVSQPLAVRRRVSFAQAVFSEKCTVEDVNAVLVNHLDQIQEVHNRNMIPVLVDPEGLCIQQIKPDVLVDGRMLKSTPEIPYPAAPCVIGLGPGFVAGLNCHAVVETIRGPFLGRVYWQGSVEQDTGVPESVTLYKNERVLRAPCSGKIHNLVDIGDVVEGNQVVSLVGAQPISAGFTGIVRGLVYEGLTVQTGMKIGDIDPRLDTRLCVLVSDKALAVGGGVLEAVLSFKNRLT